MTQPTPWVPSLVYATYAAAHPTAPFPPASLDTDFANLKVTLGGVLTNLALLQRDDGGLANGVVSVNSLGQDTKNLIAGWNPRGVWTTATNYAVKDMVTPTGGTLTYVCAIANTSGATFAADLALGYWQIVNGNGSAVLTPASITFSQTNVLLGRQTAGAGTGEEIALSATGRTLISQASLAATATTLGLGTGNAPTFAGLAISGLTGGRIPLVGASGNITDLADFAYDQSLGAGKLQVGINTNAPIADLHVKNGATSARILIESSGSGAGLLEFTGGGLGVDVAGIQHTGYNNGEKGLVFFDAVGGNFGSMTNSGWTLQSARAMQWSSSGTDPGFVDVAIRRAGFPGKLMQGLAGGVAQNFGVANTYTDVTNYEAVSFSWAANRAQVGTEKGGLGGVAREMALMTGGTQQWVLQTDGMFRPTVANTNLVDLGATTAKVRTAYIGTSIILPTGTLLGLATVRISAAQTLTTQTALQNATNLSFSIAANEEWVGAFELQFTNSIATTGLKVAVTTPAGATQNFGASLIPQNYGAGNTGYLNTTVSGTAMDFTAATEVGVNGAAVIVRCWIKAGATPGTVQLQFAQSTSSGTVLSLDAGSFLRFIRVV